MTADIIDGKAFSDRVAAFVADCARGFTGAIGRPPGLAVVLAGDNPASQVYVRNKGLRAKACGFHSVQHDLPETVAEADLLDLVDRLNRDPAIDGILVQLPLPAQIDAERVLQAIDPAKDVDGFHPVNVGLLGAGARDKALVPCTPYGCLLLIASLLGDDLSGLEAVVVGRSNIVGKPVAQLLLQHNATVTIAHSRTRALDAVCRRADILVAAVGRPGMIRGDWVKPGAVVIDVGINRVPAPDKGAGKTRLVGDVATAEAVEHARAITPVPGGVGPMTIAMLMVNTLVSAYRTAGLEPPAF